jgi:beta-galactosidase
MRYMLQQNYSMSLYMFHGGTSFGWMSGADFSEAGYEPYVTSYDYDAPLDESGRITKKYKAMRDLFAQETKAVLPEMPVAPEAMVVADFQTDGARSLWSSLPEPVRSAVPLSMEDIDQGYGYILYRTNLLSIAAPETGDLVLDGLNDYAQVFINQQLVGVLDRRHGQTTLPITLAQQATQLDILVLNSGRVNYSTAIQGERKGIRGATFKSQPVLDWQMFALPMANTTDLVYTDTSCVGPCFFTATFQLSQSAKHADTFLDITGLRKGMVWLNGRPLGRVWNIGPQKTLFVPGVWLQSGANRLTIFESDSAGGGPLSFRGLDHPVFEPVHPMPIPTEPKPPQPPKPGNNPAPNADSKSHGTGGATSGSTPSLTPSPTPSSAPSTATASGAPGAQPSGPSLVPSASPQPSSSPRGFVSGARIPDFSYHFTHHFNGHSRGQSSAGSLSEQLDHE